MELKEKLEALGKAFDEFKKTNDTRLDEIKKLGAAKPETEEKLTKIEGTMQALETKIGELNAAIARTGGQGGEAETTSLKSYRERLEKVTGRSWETSDVKKMEKYRKSFNAFMRKGIEIPGDELEFAQKTMSVDSDVNGGFLVDPEVSGEMIKLIHESNPIRQLSSVQTIGSASLKINCDLDRPASGWVGERQSRTAGSSPGVKQVEIVAHEMYAYPEATQQFLDDAAVNVEAWLNAYCSNAFALDEATAFISADGANQKPRGILSYTDGTTFGYIQRQQCAGTGALVANDLIDVQTLLKEGYQKNASWMINRLLIGTIRKIKDVTSGQYIWQPGLQESTPSILLGRPVYMNADLSTSLTDATDLIIYGDFKAAYQIVDRVGIRVLRDPFTNKPLVGFYTTKRTGGAVKNFEALKVLQQ